MAFRTTTLSGLSFYTCTCERCGHSTEPIQIDDTWASTVGDRIKEELERRGWGFNGPQAWCVICWKGMESIIRQNVENQRKAS